MEKGNIGHMAAMPTIYMTRRLKAWKESKFYKLNYISTARVNVFAQMSAGSVPLAENRGKRTNALCRNHRLRPGHHGYLTCKQHWCLCHQHRLARCLATWDREKYFQSTQEGSYMNQSFSLGLPNPKSQHYTFMTDSLTGSLLNNFLEMFLDKNWKVDNCYSTTTN